MFIFNNEKIFQFLIGQKIHLICFIRFINCVHLLIGWIYDFENYSQSNITIRSLMQYNNYILKFAELMLFFHQNTCSQTTPDFVESNNSKMHENRFMM